MSTVKPSTVLIGAAAALVIGGVLIALGVFVVDAALP